MFIIVVHISFECKINKLVCHFLVIQSSTARPADCAILIANRYGAAASTIFFIEGPAMYNLDQKITMTIFCTINNEATRTRPMVKYDLINRRFWMYVVITPPNKPILSRAAAAA